MCDTDLIVKILCSTYCTHLYIFFRLRSPCREDLQTVEENGTGRETEIRYIYFNLPANYFLIIIKALL
jgi:hypothetical protein